MSSATTERPTSMENIKVLQVGKFGVRVDEKTWFGVNAPLTPTHFAVGSGYKVSVTVSKTGKKYINEIVGVEEAGQAQAAAPATSPATAPVESDPVKAAEAALAKAKAEVEAKAKAAAALPASAPRTTSTGKDKIITMLALYKSALENPAIAQWATNPDEHIGLIRKYAVELLKDIHE
jgi:hypothetical protein